MTPKICADEASARTALAAGDRVILILPPGERAPAGLADPAHLAYLVGDAADPLVQAAAEAMAADLWPGISSEDGFR